MAKEPAKADFGPEADAAARAEAVDSRNAGAVPAGTPAPANEPAPAPAAGGVEVELTSDYWPAEQPPVEQDPRKLAVENRLRAGERVTLPQEEVMNLLERGIAKRVQK